MKTLSINTVCLILFSLCVTPHQFAQNPADDVAGQERIQTEGVDQDSVRIEIPVEDVIRLSEESVVSTLVENGNAYAIGQLNGRFFKSNIWEGVTQAFGISEGKLIFSRPQKYSDGEELFLVNLRTKEQESIFPDFSTARAAWHPTGQRFAAIVRHGSDTGLALYYPNEGRAETIKQRSVQAVLLLWGEDGDTLYFVEGEATNTQQGLSLVEYSLSTTTENRVTIDASLLTDKNDPTGGLSLHPAVPHSVREAVRRQLLLVSGENSNRNLSHESASHEMMVQALAAVADSFDYPISNVFRPTRTQGDSDGWYVTNGFGNYNSGAPCSYHIHPGDDWNRDDGQDAGEPVKAVGNGTVVSIRTLVNSQGTPLGQGIAISHNLPDGSIRYSVYVHVAVNSSMFINKTVSRGDPIATIANLSSFGPHLHFEMRTAFNPNDWYPQDDGCGYYNTTQTMLSLGFIDPVAFLDAHRSPLEGYHDGIDCDKIYGWAWNRNQPNTPINVDIYDGSALLAPNVPANQYRQDLPGNKYHAFNFPTPASLKDGRTHSISVRYSGTTSLLTYTPKSFTSTCGGGSQPAQITSPTPGSMLTGSTVIFAWNAGSGVSQYWLYVGSSLGGSDIYNVNQGTGRSATVSNIPTDGRTIYVRLWSYIGGWQWNDYTYVAASGGGGTPVISVTPSSLNFGSVAVGSSSNLNFAVQNVGGGTLSGSASVPAPFSVIAGGSYNLTSGQSQSVTVRFTPTAAQSYSQTATFTGAGGATRPVTGTGTSSGSAPTVSTGSAAGVTSNSATLNGNVNPNGLATTVYFQWGPTTSYGNQTSTQSAGSGTNPLGVSANLGGLSPGTTYHYRLVGSNSAGTNFGSDVSFTTSSGGGSGPAQITSPTPGSTLSGSTATFIWNASSGASDYWLYVGNSVGGSDIYNREQGLNLSATVSGIPTDGRTIYLRLWTYLGGWLFNDYTYRTASSGGGSATNRLLNPSFESGPSNWVQFSSAGYANITNSAPTAARTGSWLAWLGGADNLTEYIYQDVSIPANATQANLQFYYKIATNEGASTTCFDRLAVEVRRPSDNALLATLTTRCNYNQTSAWTSSGLLNLQSFRGQTIRLRFIVTTDSSLPSSFFLDDITMVADGN